MDFYVIADRELVLAFNLSGIQGSACENRDDVLDAFNRITGRSHPSPVDKVPRVLIISEACASMIEEEEIAWQKTGKYPLIVEIPCLDGHVEGKKSLSDAIREAVGVQV